MASTASQAGATVTLPAPAPTYTLNPGGGTGIIAEPPNSQFVGSTSANGYTYQTTVTYVTGLLGNTSEGINHYLSVPEGGREAVDGLVAVLVVHITERPTGCVPSLWPPKICL
jgi:hypothetical protein